MRFKPIEELTFTDDFMFYKVMQDKEICKELLELLLKIKIEKIEYPELQKDIKPFYSTKGIRLDVYVKDSNRIFDIEIQTTVPSNLAKRTRYYQSMVDVDALLKGEDYTKLKESYIIFLCTKDPFGLKLPVYTFKTVCMESKDHVLKDGANRLFFNACSAKHEKDVEIRAFLGYLLKGKSCDMFTDKIDSMVAKLKDDEKFRSEYMAGAAWFVDAKKEGYDEGIAKQKAEDEKLIAQITSQKNAEIQQLKAELEKLKSNRKN